MRFKVIPHFKKQYKIVHFYRRKTMAGTNRMVEKSRKAIKDALLELMYEKDFKSITVNELLKKADISRGTFYAHFKNLEDVRQSLIDDLYLHADMLFGDYRAGDLAEDVFPIMLLAAEYMMSSRDPAKRVFKFINVYDLGITLKQWLTKFIMEDEDLVERMGGQETALTYARFISGGCMHAYNMWMLDDCPISPESLARDLADMLMTGLKGCVKTKADEETEK